LSIDDINENVSKINYAVRGPIVNRASQLSKEGRHILYCNIGNPHALNQKAMSFVRQVISICEYPELASILGDKFTKDVLDYSKNILKEVKNGLGSYSESNGYFFIREAVSRFINQRDGNTASSPESVYLTDGATQGIQLILNLLIKQNDGIMIPIPQYPLYSATINMLSGKPVHYLHNENKNWDVDLLELEKSIIMAKSKGINVKAICVINPGNPTGSVLSEESIENIIYFAEKHNLTILADEVYQENIYKGEFHSFAKIISKLRVKSVSLFSFHSTSKGFFGECGHRGGFFEAKNVPLDVLEQINKIKTISLCPNTVGQIITYMMVNPPKNCDISFKTYENEKLSILNSLAKKAKLVEEGFKNSDGITVNTIEGALYAFPKIRLHGEMNDNEWCLKLLEETGICVVPGSGFGQEEGTFHFRMTLLPDEDELRIIINKILEFNSRIRNCNF